MTSEQVRSLVLQGLRLEPLNLYELADVIDVPPFRVRGELSAMKRDHLVREHMDVAAGQRKWILTGRGFERATRARQGVLR